MSNIPVPVVYIQQFGSPQTRHCRFNIKHIYHVNPNCKYLKDKEFVGSMPPLVRTVSGPSKVKTKIKGKLSKADIGQPFDFIHVEGTRKMLNNVDEDHVADDSAEDAE
jgi:hypothetical protein